MWMMNAGKPTKIPPLNDAMVIELGANILGEIIIFVIAAVIIVSEVGRQKRKEENKERLRKEELDKLKEEVLLIRNQMGRHEDEILRLFDIISQLENAKSAKKSRTGSSNVQPRPPSPPKAVDVNFYTMPAPSEEVPSSCSVLTGNPRLVSVASSSLSCTASQFSKCYTSIHSATVLVPSTGDSRANLVLSPTRQFCDINTKCQHVVVNDRVVASDRGIIFDALAYVVTDLFHKRTDCYVQNNYDICSCYLEK